MSAKAKARFAVGFVIAILLAVIAILAFSFTSTKLIAQDSSVVYEKKMENCDTSGGGGSAPQCVVGEKCEPSASGTYCDAACTILVNQ